MTSTRSSKRPMQDEENETSSQKTKNFISYFKGNSLKEYELTQSEDLVKEINKYKKNIYIKHASIGKFNENYELKIIRDQRMKKN